MLIRPADVPKKPTDLLEQLQGLPTRIGRSVYFLLIEGEAREEEYMAGGPYTGPLTVVNVPKLHTL